jgi:spore germination cell wall hydrolase CwlJ-like protein
MAVVCVIGLVQIEHPEVTTASSSLSTSTVENEKITYTSTIKPTMTLKPTAKSTPKSIKKVTPKPTQKPKATAKKTAKPKDTTSKVNAKTNDRELLARVVKREAGNQSDKGQQAVVEVILNRVKSKRFPNTIRGVVYQKGQFSCASVLFSSKKSIPTKQNYKNVDLVLQGKVNNLPDNVVYFSKGPQGSGIYKKIGAHYFCYI